MESRDVTMKPGTITYRAFLLRVWTPPYGSGLRASIRDVETGETRVLLDLDQLPEWLNREMCMSAQGPVGKMTGSP